MTHLRQQEEGLLVVSGDDFSQRAIHTNVSNCNREQTVMDFACTMMDLYPCVFFFLCVCACWAVSHETGTGVCLVMNAELDNSHCDGGERFGSLPC